jgi:hypothetical protein
VPESEEEVRLYTQRDYWRLELYMAMMWGGSSTLCRDRIERVPSSWLRAIVLDGSVPQN